MATALQILGAEWLVFVLGICLIGIVALVFGGSTKPITVAIFTQLRSFSANIDIIAPAAFVSLAVPLAVFFAFQRQFVRGLLAGSVK